MQTVATLVNLAGQKLSVEGAKDPVEAKKAIDAARQMLPLVPDEAVGADPERARPGPDALCARRARATAPDQPSEQPPQQPPPSKIWTPGS